jgi:hypothetical protein
MLRSVLAASLVVVLAARVPSAYTAPVNSSLEIKALIDRLVSPNPAPDTAKLKASENKPDGGWPRGYDHKKQDEVDGIRRKLMQVGPLAFPFLIERWKDERYCRTIEVAEYVNQSVGEVCRDIVSDQLQPYGVSQAGYADPRGKPLRPDYMGMFLGSQESALKWWEKTKDKSLSQMQLEALDWVIAEEAKRPADFKDKEQGHLQALRKKLVEGGKPLSR